MDDYSVSQLSFTELMHCTTQTGYNHVVSAPYMHTPYFTEL